MAALQPDDEAAENLAMPQPIQGRVHVLEPDRLRDRWAHDALFDQAQRHTRVVPTTSPRSENGDLPEHEGRGIDRDVDAGAIATADQPSAGAQTSQGHLDAVASARRFKGNVGSALGPVHNSRALSRLHGYFGAH